MTSRRSALPLLMVLLVVLSAAEDAKAPLNTTSHLPGHQPVINPLPVASKSPEQGQEATNQKPGLSPGSVETGKDATPAETDKTAGSEVKDGVQPSKPVPASMQKVQGALETFFQQIQSAQKTAWDVRQGKDEVGPNPGQTGPPGLPRNQAAKQNLPKKVISEGHNDPADETSGTQPSSVGNPAWKGQPGHGSQPQQKPAGLKSDPGNRQLVGAPKIVVLQSAGPRGTDKTEGRGQQSVPPNGTRASFGTRKTLSNMKYVTMTMFMVIVGMTVMAFVILSTNNRRRRRQYDRCRGLSDDCEMRSNFQLVNHDERLGIRTSSNYLM